MPKKDDLRGYLLATAFGADGEVSLSSEDIYEVFAADYLAYGDFEIAFEGALIWLREEDLVRYDYMASGTKGESCVLGLVATGKGEKAVTTLTNAPDRSGGLHIELARMIGAGLGEFVNTQK